ncbi:trimethylamine methyltransferase family protein [Rhodovibrionaceae bacterium A322]
MAGRERRRRRSSPAQGRESGGLRQLPSSTLRNTFKPTELLSADQVEAIQQASLKLLCDTGMNFLLPEAVEILRQERGVRVADDGVRVRFDPDFVEEKVALAPETFQFHTRNPDRQMQFGGDGLVIGSVASAPHATNLDVGRQTGTFEHYCNLIKLGQAVNVCHTFGGYPVEPVDIDPRVRHLDAIEAMATLSDKGIYGYALGRERMEDAIELARISRGIDRERLLAEPSVFTIVNANSPLIYDSPMLEGTIAMARANQPVVFTPFTLAGAMAPITLAGALTQQNAEALAGIAFAQSVNPGCPVVYGSFTSNVDMKSGSPAFGTPEYVKATIASGQLARRNKVPLRASNANASNAADAQATYESQMSIWACLLGRVNFMMHGLGWLEGGLSASYEKFIIDAEMLQMMTQLMQPLAVDDEEMAVDAIGEVGPGMHFFASPHTIARYEQGFYSPLLSDWQNFENYRDNGSVDATQRANGIWKKLLQDFEAPPMDEGTKDELADFVARRKAEGGAPPL